MPHVEVLLEVDSDIAELHPDLGPQIDALATAVNGPPSTADGCPVLHVLHARECAISKSIRVSQLVTKGRQARRGTRTEERRHTRDVIDVSAFSPVVTFVLVPWAALTKVESADRLDDMAHAFSEAEPLMKLHIVSFELRDAPRGHPGATSPTEHRIQAQLAVSCQSVVGVTFAHCTDDVISALRPVVEYLVSGHLVKSAAEVDAEALTEPVSDGAKVDVDWRAGYQRMLCEIPHITARRARCVMLVFGTLNALLQEVDKQLSKFPGGAVPNDAANVTVDNLTSKFALLANTNEPDASDTGADRQSRRFGLGNVLRVIRGVSTPVDRTLLCPLETPS